MPKTITLIVGLWMALPAVAQDMPEITILGGDLYGGGTTVVATDASVHDVFLAGQDARLAAPIAGSAHLAGQTVTIEDPVAGNAYAAGQTITLTGPIAGSATLAGQRIAVGDVGRNLRAFGQSVSLNGTIGGAALIAAQSVTFDGVVTGDVAVNASAIEFGPAASIGGTLTVYHEDPASIDVPSGVVPEERILRKTVEEWSEDAPAPMDMGRDAIWRGLLTTVVTVTVLAAIIAALIPARLSQVRATFLARPLRSFWFGFLTLSAAIGTTVVLAMSLIGLLALPVSIALAVVLGFGGYIVGAYALGVGMLSLLGRDVPGAWIERALSAAVGAIIIAVVGLIPIIGWILVLTVLLTGLGALCIVFLRPQFYAEAAPSA